MSEREDKEMTQYGFYFDQKVCAGCHTCQIACKDRNRLDVGYLLRDVKSYERGEFPAPAIYHFAKTCGHCTDAPCVKACPVGRARKDEETGIVYYDPEVACLGDMCGLCINACPYDHPVMVVEKNQAMKCDMCRDLLAEGQEPACVASCMMRVIKAGPVAELKEKYGPDLVAALPCYPDGGSGTNFLTKPSPAALEKDFEEKET